MRSRSHLRATPAPRIPRVLRTVPLRLRVCLVLLAWFAQLCLPMAHAALMGQQPASSLTGWCGDPRQAADLRAYVAELPAELRDALGDTGTGAHALDACATLCAVAGTPPPLATPPVTVALRAAGLEPRTVATAAPLVPATAPRPPAQGPPVRA